MALYSGNAKKDDPRFALGTAIIFQYEMMAVFGGRAQLLAAPEIEVQRVWLAFQAKIKAQNDAAEKANTAK